MKTMPTVIRATDQNLGVHRPGFNFEDMAAQAQRYLDKVRAEAEAIVAAAQREAAEIKRRAQAEGQVAGHKEIEQLAATQLGQRLESLLPALRQAVAGIGHARQAWLAHWEKAAVRLAAAIAGRVLRQELDRRPELPLVFLRESLELAAGSGRLRIHLHPADHAALAPRAAVLVKELAAVAQAEIVADAAIERGGCRVDTAFGSIDQQFQAQLARIEEELT